MPALKRITKIIRCEKNHLGTPKDQLIKWVYSSLTGFSWAHVKVSVDTEEEDTPKKYHSEW